MLEYDIKSWDGSLNRSTLQPAPILTIEPDEPFLEFINQHPEFYIKVIGTESPYENKLAVATAQSGTWSLGYRPNYECATGFYTIRPNIFWRGYPPQRGRVRLIPIQN